MVRFDAHLRGTSADAWAGFSRLDDLPELDFTALDRVVVIAPHPDDETFGCGGLIAVASAAGISVTVIVVTDGSASHPDSPTTTADQVVSIRAQEVARAAAQLGDQVTVARLNFPDGGSEESREAIRLRLQPQLLFVSAATLVLIPWTGDGHPDHRIVGEISASILQDHARTLAYPVWMWHWADPSDARLPWDDAVRFEVPPSARSRKANAIAEYRSQIEPLSPAAGDETVMDAPVLEHFRGTREVYFRTTPSAAGPGTTAPEDAKRSSRLGRAYFDELYANDDDPWKFQTRWYEERKRALTVASLTRQRYPSALEVGCSLGLLTELLAPRADRLLSTDISASAVSAARARTAHFDHVEIEQQDLAEAFPEGRFDLIVISEVAYYLDADTLRGVAREAADHLTPDGELLLCHWRHPVEDYPLSGDAAHQIIRDASGLYRVLFHEEKDLFLELLAVTDESVAQRTGLA